jgi:hypothetical protein
MGEVSPDKEESGKSGVLVFYAEVVTDDYK